MTPSIIVLFIGFLIIMFGINRYYVKKEKKTAAKNKEDTIMTLEEEIKGYTKLIGDVVLSINFDIKALEQLHKSGAEVPLAAKSIKANLDIKEIDLRRFTETLNTLKIHLKEYLKTKETK